MPSVIYNGQSLALDHRRIWVVGGGLQYGRVAEADWAERLARVRQAGFNTVQTACPWSLHEPRKGKFDFEGQADIGRFLGLCAEAGLRSIVQVGPFIGHGFDAGGLPGRLTDVPGARLREADPVFMPAATKYIRKLAAEIVPLQITMDGSVILVQVEQGWRCTNDAQSVAYLREFARILRESGINVPITNANGLWPDADDTITTWQGNDHMLAHVRQLHTVQPHAPRIVSELPSGPLAAWGDASLDEPDGARLLRTVAEVLAAGGQPVVDPLHGGTNFGFTGGQRPGELGAPLLTTPCPAAPLDESGAPTSALKVLGRLTTFASSFEHVFAGLDPQYQPVAIAPDAVASNGFSVVPLRGAQGRVVFVFAGSKARKTDLLLDHGVRLSIDLGDQPVGWYALDTDLGGRGRLDYANISPFAIVDRSIVVFQGPEKAPILISIDGTPMQGTVPTGRKPLVMRHKSITIVICNQTQIDVACDDGKCLHIGVDGFAADGTPIPAAGWAKRLSIDADGEVTETSQPRKRNGRQPVEAVMDAWCAAPADAQVEGTSPRYATLDGPSSLLACGATRGYGWYRIEMKTASTGKRLMHVPGGGDRLHFFLDGERAGTFGTGADAEIGPIEWKATKGPHTLVVLAENAGRHWDGADLGRPAGLTDHLYEVKAMRAVKPKIAEADPVDPFELRSFIPEATHGQTSDPEQAVWTFTHARKTPILVHVLGAEPSGTFVLNGAPIAYYAGRRGVPESRLLLHPSDEGFKRGRNELRFAPDRLQPGAAKALAAHATLYECTASITGAAKWAFARWEPPTAKALRELGRSDMKSVRGRPCWWSTRVSIDAKGMSLRLVLTGLTRGHVFLNGNALGRYVVATGDKKSAGPVTSLALPASWLDDDGTAALVIFDEHGAAPTRCKVVARP